MASNLLSTCIILGLVLLFIDISLCFATVAQSVDDPPLPALGPAKVPTDYCDFYNVTHCETANSSCGTVQCGPHDPDKRNHCFVLWHNDTDGKVTVRMKGCFINTLTCYDRPNCIEEGFSTKNNLMFCCCEGNMCNQNFSWVPSVPEPPLLDKIDPVEEENQQTVYSLLMYVLVALGILITSVVGFLIYRRKKLSFFNELPTAEPSISCPPSPHGLDEGCPLPVILKEVKARGRFGAVYRGQLHQQEVAVKVFPVQDKQSWMSEQEIFKLPQMNHPDILQYIGIHKQGDNLQAEYWLITAYHEKGSLCDYLKAHNLTWSEACRIAVTMSRGLTHLHDEIGGSLGGFKPSVAHRDFKSKNVLLKKDMSACIADFGLALVFQPGKPCGDTHGQVGTRRYMAPEVLEGAINFTRDAFLRIDMYACGLVLWEIASRCSANEDTKIEYLLPFEEEIGSHPTLEEMQDAVVLRKIRPRILDSWRNHNGLSVMCDTMEECWDHDAEARLSASCVLERISCHTRATPLIPLSYSDTPLLIENTAPIHNISS